MLVMTAPSGSSSLLGKFSSVPLRISLLSFSRTLQLTIPSDVEARGRKTEKINGIYEVVNTGANIIQGLSGAVDTIKGWFS